jgi:hypothetical protein
MVTEDLRASQIARPEELNHLEMEIRGAFLPCLDISEQPPITKGEHFVAQTIEYKRREKTIGSRVFPGYESTASYLRFRR